MAQRSDPTQSASCRTRQPGGGTPALHTTSIGRDPARIGMAGASRYAGPLPLRRVRRLKTSLAGVFGRVRDVRPIRRELDQFRARGGEISRSLFVLWRSKMNLLLLHAGSENGHCGHANRPLLNPAGGGACTQEF